MTSQPEIEISLKLADCMISPATMGMVVSKGEYQLPAHIQLIDDALVRAIEAKQEKIIVIDAPPRHGKSLLVSKYLPAWFLTRYPTKNVILTTYGAEFARSWGRKARAVLTDNEELFGRRVSPEQAAAADWETTEGGGMITAGVGGPITGRGADLFVIDDYMKNAEESVSETMRDKHWEWWQSTASTRVEPGGIVVIIATRWHKDDLTGRLLKENDLGWEIEHIHLPAYADDTDSMGRIDDDEPLWPERFSNDQLKRIRNNMEIYWWMCLYMQNPSKHGRTEWPADYFEDLWCEEERWPDLMEWSVIAIDPSKGRSQKSDYCGIVFVGLSGGNLYVDAIVERIPAEQIATRGVDFAEMYQTDLFGVESNAFQDLLAPILDAECRDRGYPPLPLRLINNMTDKNLRIGRIGPYLARKKLKFRRTKGCEMLIRQLHEWPLGDYDDGPDALEMALRLLTLGKPVIEYQDEMIEI